MEYEEKHSFSLHEFHFISLQLALNRLNILPAGCFMRKLNESPMRTVGLYRNFGSKTLKFHCF